MIFEVLRVVMLGALGGAVAADRAAGWSLMLSQPIVASCLAGAIVNPGPAWELWALRIPIGVGALLQLLLTDASLPAAQRQHDTATAGVVGTTVAILAMKELHELFPAQAAGALWVVVGVLAGLLAAIGGGWVMGLHRAWNRVDTRRAEEFAAEGNAVAFEWRFTFGLFRVVALGAAWSLFACWLGLVACHLLLPRIAPHLTGRNSGILFAGLLGCGLATAWHAHVRGRSWGPRWAALGAAAAVVLGIVLRRGTP